MDSPTPDNKADTKSVDVARSFSGRVCPLQPAENQLLVVNPDPRSSGCDIKTFPTEITDKDTFDVLKLFQEARPSASYLKMTGTADGAGTFKAGTHTRWGGSGLTVDKEDNACLIISDSHVPDATPDQHVKVDSVNAVMPDGQAYNASVIARDASKDLALLKVDTGSKTTEVCHPAKIVANEIEVGGDQGYFSKHLLSIGQPYTSGAMYTSFGPVVAEDKRDSISGVLKPLPGEDAQRKIIAAGMPVREGFSGAGAFNNAGEAVGLVDIGTSPKTSVITPISRATIDELKARRTDTPK